MDNEESVLGSFAAMEFSYTGHPLHTQREYLIEDLHRSERDIAHYSDEATQQTLGERWTGYWANAMDERRAIRYELVVLDRMMKEIANE